MFGRRRVGGVSLLGGKQPGFDEESALFDSFRQIDSQHDDGSSSYRGFTPQFGAFPLEMIVSVLLPRIE